MRVDGNQHATGAFHHNDIAARREARIRGRHDGEVDGHARLRGGQVRRDGRRKRERIPVGDRRVDIAGLVECDDVGVDRCIRFDACGYGLHAHGTPSGRDQRAQQRDGDDGLAHAGVRAGDEDASRHVHRPGRVSFTIGCPSAVRLGSPFHAWP